MKIIGIRPTAFKGDSGDVTGKNFYVTYPLEKDGQKPGGNAQRKQGVAGHQVPALGHQLNYRVHRGHDGAHASGGYLSLRSFLLS